MKGEVRVELLLDDDRNFAADRAVVLASPSRELETVVERFRRQSGRCVVKLRGIDSIDDAEKVIGAEIRIPAGKLLIPPERFRLQNLTKPWDLGRKFDVALCLEGAEHLHAVLAWNDRTIPNRARSSGM